MVAKKSEDIKWLNLYNKVDLNDEEENFIYDFYLEMCKKYKKVGRIINNKKKKIKKEIKKESKKNESKKEIKKEINKDTKNVIKKDVKKENIKETKKNK